MLLGTNKEKLREHGNIEKKWKGTREQGPPWETLFNLHVIYKTLTVSSSSNLHVIYMISLSFILRIYSIFSHIYMFKYKNLHDIYMIIENM